MLKKSGGLKSVPGDTYKEAQVADVKSSSTGASRSAGRGPGTTTMEGLLKKSRGLKSVPGDTYKEAQVADVRSDRMSSDIGKVASTGPGPEATTVERLVTKSRGLRSVCEDNNKGARLAEVRSDRMSSDIGKVASTGLGPEATTVERLVTKSRGLGSVCEANNKGARLAEVRSDRMSSDIGKVASTGPGPEATTVERLVTKSRGLKSVCEDNNTGAQVAEMKLNSAQSDDSSNLQSEATVIDEQSSSDESVNVMTTPNKEHTKLHESNFEEDGTGSNPMITVVEDIPTWRAYSTEHGLGESDPEDKEVGFDEKISLWRGDITKLEVDVVVKAAKKSLLGGDGVDGAIHRVAGPALREECDKLCGCEVGQAKITGAYELPAKYVVHTVGPTRSEDLLYDCYKNSLAIFRDMDQRTIAFPCISTGMYGFPKEQAADIALSATKQFLKKNKDQVDRIIFCVFDYEDAEIYERLLKVHFPGTPDVNEPEGALVRREIPHIAGVYSKTCDEGTLKCLNWDV